MAGLNIPGVTDQYNTNDTVEKLMKVERIPLVREENQLEKLKSEKDAWRDINTKLTSLRDKTKTLYSFENPFNNKISSSTQENSITAEATRSADLQSFKVDVIQNATSDRFLTDELNKDYKIPNGTYTFKVGEKQIVYNFKGGSIKDFSEGINKRGNNLIKSSIIGASSDKKSLLIEAIPTGKENKLIFEDDAKKFAFDSGMIEKIKSQNISFGTKQDQILPVQKIQNENSHKNFKYLPELSLTKTNIENEKINVNSRGAFKVDIPSEILQKNQNEYKISFSVTSQKVSDITEEINKSFLRPEIQNSGNAEFKGIVITNKDSDSKLNLTEIPPTPLNPISNENIFYAVLEDGKELPIKTPNILEDSQNLNNSQNEQNIEKQFSFNLSEFPNIKSIAVRNENTGVSFKISDFSITKQNEDLGFGPKNPVSVADDAIIKYEGITITRPTNKIDDVIPEITLNIKEKTKETATISIKPDVESSKDAIIQFVGQYNQVVAQINILSQNKGEIIEELDYLTDEEKDNQKEKLGLFMSDFSLTNIKSNMQSIVAAKYPFSDTAEVTMLSQLGVSTNAGGYSGGYSQSRLRGYLEIDEKKLDSALENHLDDIKQLFGFDTDGDLVMDSGIALRLDKQLTAYTQIGGILATKTSTLDSKIKSSESKISKLESQMADKEAELRSKYSQMQGSLNSLESQQNAISNFAKQNNRN